MILSRAATMPSLQQSKTAMDLQFEPETPRVYLIRSSAGQNIFPTSLSFSRICYLLSEAPWLAKYEKKSTSSWKFSAKPFLMKSGSCFSASMYLKSSKISWSSSGILILVQSWVSPAMTMFLIFFQATPQIFKSFCFLGRFFLISPRPC